MNTEAKIQALIDSRMMTTDEEVQAFEALAADLVATGDVSIVGALCKAFDDDTWQDDVMFGLIDGIEHVYDKDIRAGLAQLAAAVPAMLDHAKDWCEILHIRILNEEVARGVYRDVLAGLDDATKKTVMLLLCEIEASDRRRFRDAVAFVLNGSYPRMLEDAAAVKQDDLLVNMKAIYTQTEPDDLTADDMALEIERAPAFLGQPLPDDYVAFITKYDEIEFTVAGNWTWPYFRLWGMADLIEMNEAYGVPKFMPNGLIIGTDGGSEAITYATYNGKFGIYTMGFGDLNSDDAVYIASSLTELLLSKERLFRMMSTNGEWSERDVAE